VASGEHVQVTGVPQVAHAFDGLASSAADVTRPSTELGRVGRDASLAVVPHLTGALGDAIVANVDTHGVALSVSGIAYAAVMEFGGRYVLEHRYMKAGFDAMSEATPEVYGRFLDENVKRAGG
jgi:hypothetical protein